MCGYVCMNAGAQGRVFALTASCLRGKLIPPVLISEAHCFCCFAIIGVTQLSCFTYYPAFLFFFFFLLVTTKSRTELNPQQEIILTGVKT